MLFFITKSPFIVKFSFLFQTLTLQRCSKIKVVGFSYLIYLQNLLKNSVVLGEVHTLFIRK